MGDKSPKQKNKSAKQKATVEDGKQREKAAAIAAKQVPPPKR